MKKMGQRDRAVWLVWKRFGWLVLIVLAVLLMRAVWGMHLRFQEAEKYQERAQKELTNVEGREKELRENIASLKNDRGIEAALRDRFGLVKEGEGVVIVVDEEVSEVPEEPQSWWRWLGW